MTKYTGVLKYSCIKNYVKYIYTCNNDLHMQDVKECSLDVVVVGKNHISYLLLWFVKKSLPDEFSSVLTRLFFELLRYDVEISENK